MFAVIAVITGGSAYLFYFLETHLAGTIGLITNLLLSMGLAGFVFVAVGRLLGVRAISDILQRIQKRFFKK